MGTWIAIKSLIPLLIHLFVSVDTASVPCHGLKACANISDFLSTRDDPFPIERNSRVRCNFLNAYKECIDEESKNCQDTRVSFQEQGNLYLQSYLCKPRTFKDIEGSPCYGNETYIYLQQQLRECLKFPDWREQKKPRRCRVRSQQLNCTLSIVTQICGWKVALHVKKRNEIVDHYDNMKETCMDNKICKARKFQCENNRCIHRRFVCDGKMRCYNGEDERHCNNVTTPPTSTIKKVKTPPSLLPNKVKTPPTSTTNKVTIPPTSTVMATCSGNPQIIFFTCICMIFYISF